jgi:type IV pilus assembly protein PilA
VSKSLRRARGFTLVELMAAIAILSILAAVAIPAYNSYTTKSKFSEVVLATAPTKAAITICAETGDCVSAGQIVLSGTSGTLTAAQISAIINGVTPPTAPTAPTVATTDPTQLQVGSSPNTYDTNAAMIWAFYYGNAINNQAEGGSQAYTPAQAAALANFMASNSEAAVSAGQAVYYLKAVTSSTTELCGIPSSGSVSCTNAEPNIYTSPYVDNVSNTYYTAYSSQVASANAAAVASANAVYSAEVASTNAIYSAEIVSAVAAASSSAASNVAPANTIPCVGTNAGCSPPTKYAASVSYDTSGNITATAQSSSGLAGETYVLNPAYSSGRVDWTSTGTCKTRAGGALC